MKQLKLSIKPKSELSEKQYLRSSAYSVRVGDWELGKGVQKMTLEMDAGKKPKLTIEAAVDYMDIDIINGLGLELVDISDNQNHILTSNEVAELAELRNLRRSNNNFKVLSDKLKQKEKQNSILSIALFGLVAFIIVTLLYYYG
ncbi:MULTISPECIES: FKBP-type peptidyl-prolyl cis-trans isomerase [unclassified Streptococcus]|uniref:FKBP-type peptidyl-prolyl cis-trans isomerase n=1 Tax=unclassified Streptococcus TaxID=2608887 RepID=UPI00211B1CD3|nr:MULTISPECIES: FKBP-type peptidyl-prolyl cis-trans isomerase [unclassified Streptococcus]MCQ9212259.1 FKBP-type peptidyl-prolyl cis-trans isomerase [Streptococcus sp. B01]MCQ9213590.1 FKBP-type peptidyl-prolyl cis-trans isomerase [Streptococcus sp. O1]